MFPPGGARWLTVVSSETPDGVELLLEPLALDFAVTWQKELYSRGIPLTSFGVDDVDAEYIRLKDPGVEFREPAEAVRQFPSMLYLTIPAAI